jgi:hypothetical protein
MSKFAIKGHGTRGCDIINLLKMLGGNNNHLKCDGYNQNNIYYIDYNDNNYIKTNEYFSDGDYNNMIIFTIEKFESTYPYKIGDKVVVNNNVEIINRMYWIDKHIVYGFFTKRNIGELTVDKIKPYIKNNVNDNPNSLQKLKKYIDNTPIDIIEKEWNELSNLNEIGTTIDEYLEHVNKYRERQYPKSYDECYKYLYPTSTYIHSTIISGYMYDKIKVLSHLLLCRDVYWKLYGEQIGLCKPWKPDLNDGSIKYGITYSYRGISKRNYKDISCILIFPTENLRDVFYENFKNEIEICKELL